MKSKLNYLIGISLKRKVKTKWFVIANVMIALITMAAINVDSLISFFGGDFDKKTNIYVVDNTGESFDIFKKEMEAPNPITGEKETKYKIQKYDKSVKEASKKLEDKKEKNSIILLFEKEENVPLKATVTTNEYLSTTEYGTLNTAIQNTKVALAIQDSNIPASTLSAIYDPIQVERKILDKDKKSEEESMDMIMTTAFPIIILPFFMLTLFLVQMIGAEVNDEKTTRGMEIIISNVSPKTHFFAKVIAGNLFVLIQSVLLFLYGALGLVLRSLIGGSKITGGIFDGVTEVAKNVLNSGVGDKLIYIIPLTLLLMVLTFVAYSLLAGVLASMTTNIEDFQQLQTPIIIISLIGYYLAMMAGVFNGALFIKVVSFIPFISAILSPSLLMLGQIGVIEVIVSIVIMVVTNFLLIKYGLKIYKVGILNYSSSGLWKKMFKALKE